MELYFDELGPPGNRACKRVIKITFQRLAGILATYSTNFQIIFSHIRKSRHTFAHLMAVGMTCAFNPYAQLPQAVLKCIFEVITLACSS